MNEMKERIAVLQKDLNRLLASNEHNQCPSLKIYSLSVRLDQEIVRYYKSLMNAKCS